MIGLIGFVGSEGVLLSCPVHSCDDACPYRATTELVPSRGRGTHDDRRGGSLWSPMTRSERRRGRTLDRWVSGFLGRAGVGAGVTVLVSVLPVLGLIAPAIGGGVASWTDSDAADRGSRVGAAAGGLVTLLSLPLTFVAVAAASTISPAATIGVLALTLVGAVYVIGSAALGGHLVDEAMAKREASMSASAVTPIERLKHRYVAGELDDTEFERRLDRLVTADADQPGARGATDEHPIRDSTRRSERPVSRGREKPDRDRVNQRPARGSDHDSDRELADWEWGSRRDRESTASRKR